MRAFSILFLGLFLAAGQSEAGSGESPRKDLIGCSPLSPEKRAPSKIKQIEAHSTPSFRFDGNGKLAVDLERDEEIEAPSWLFPKVENPRVDVVTVVNKVTKVRKNYILNRNAEMQPESLTYAETNPSGSRIKNQFLLFAYDENGGCFLNQVSFRLPNGGVRVLYNLDFCKSVSQAPEVNSPVVNTDYNPDRDRERRNATLQLVREWDKRNQPKKIDRMVPWEIGKNPDDGGPDPASLPMSYGQMLDSRCRYYSSAFPKGENSGRTRVQKAWTDDNGAAVAN